MLSTSVVELTPLFSIIHCLNVIRAIENATSTLPKNRTKYYLESFGEACILHSVFIIEPNDRPGKKS